MLYPRTKGKIIPLSNERLEMTKKEMAEVLKALHAYGPDEKARLLKKLQLKAKEIVNEQRR